MSGYTPGYPTRGNGLAIASMVCSLLSFVCLGPVMSIPGVVCGHSALGAIRRGEMDPDARGFALAGLIVGYLNIAVSVVGILAYIGIILLAGSGTVSPFVYTL